MSINRILLFSVGLALLTASCATSPTVDTVEETLVSSEETAVQTESRSEETVALDDTAVIQNDEQSDEATQRKDAVASSSGTELPVKTESGDFLRRTNHSSWQVVDTDLTGLNCRWSPDMPELWYSPSAEWPELDVQNWPVERTFTNGTMLTSNGTPAGFMTMMDSRGLPWLKVQLEERDQICLVRANDSYIVPVP